MSRSLLNCPIQHPIPNLFLCAQFSEGHTWCWILSQLLRLTFSGSYTQLQHTRTLPIILINVYVSIIFYALHTLFLSHWNNSMRLSYKGWGIWFIVCLCKISWSSRVQTWKPTFGMKKLDVLLLLMEWLQCTRSRGHLQVKGCRDKKRVSSPQMKTTPKDKCNGFQFL